MSVAEMPVASFMRRDYLPEVAPEEPVAEVARLMLKHNTRRVCVVEGGRLVGIVSRGDVVRAVVQPAIGEGTETDK